MLSLSNLFPDEAQQKVQMLYIEILLAFNFKSVQIIGVNRSFDWPSGASQADLNR